MFDSLPKDSRPIAVLKQAMLVFFVAFLLIGVVSSHRAYFQVRSLELKAEPALRAGSIIQTHVVSSGRTYVDVEVELRQGNHSEKLATQRVPGNEYGFFDPRMQQASQEVELLPYVLASFNDGPAQVRATARGHSQWMRVPPPVVREIDVVIRARD